MNLAALAARGSDIQRSLDEMTIGLNHNAHNISWCDFSRLIIMTYWLVYVSGREHAPLIAPFASQLSVNPPVCSFKSPSRCLFSFPINIH